MEESISTLEIFPSTSTLENEIQKYVQIRDFGLIKGLLNLKISLICKSQQPGQKILRLYYNC